MTLALDLPDCPPSFLQGFDPRWKLASLLTAALAFALLRHCGPAVAALAGSLLLVALARTPWSWYVRRIATATVMYVLFLVWLPFVARKRAMRRRPLGMLTISQTGDVAFVLVLSLGFSPA